MTEINNDLKFNISLSVLNHLGRNLYRNFITVLGEAISNSWDAEASNVWIEINRDSKSFSIKDDGNGMTLDDFQNKFLKIGYSKRKEGIFKSPDKMRPYIGAKGIGKLALLSCASQISIISKKNDTEYVGGMINNSELDDAIKNDITPDQYSLNPIDIENFSDLISDHSEGTILLFDDIKNNIRNTIPHLKKLIALYFRFSIVDSDFKIYVNGSEVSNNDLSELSDSTEFVWKINNIVDPFLDTLTKIKKDAVDIQKSLSIKGFVATVETPKKLKITGTQEKIGIDLFANGRLREKDIMKHIPTARFLESYLYGQIHFDDLDIDNNDRFTSSREGVKEDDEKFIELIDLLKREIIPQILNEWDAFRLEKSEDGDDENPRKTKKARKARSLFNLASNEFRSETSSNHFVDRWNSELQPEAEFNIPAYVDCFLSENLIRKYINENSIPMTTVSQRVIDRWKPLEEQRKTQANINFSIRRDDNDLFFLGMDELSIVVEDNRQTENISTLVRDAKEYKPIRNVVGHTGLLTDLAKAKLTLVFENIKARIKRLLDNTTT